MLSKIKQLIRLTHINFVLIKHGLDKVVLSIPIFSPIKFLSYFNPWNWFGKKEKTNGERLRYVLEELGPIFVKFGQTLSTRSDIFPEDIIAELSKLQDQVPSFPSDKAKRIIEDELGKKISELFIEFAHEPIASASIAQVHAAKLQNGQDVVVKVLRPNIEKIIRQDVDLLMTFAKLVERYWSQGKRLHPVDIVKEFEKTIFDELDLLREAANASQLRRNFEDSDILYVPEVFWPYTSNKIMVMERIQGIPVADVETLKQNNVDLKILAERGVEIFFTQVFRDCFFHADMHPGNIFVDISKPESPKYIAIDFGIMGSLSPADQCYLAENFMAFFKRDYRRVSMLHIESGWVPYDTRIEEFESAMRTVCEPIFEKPLKDISFGKMLMRLFQTGRRFQMEVQPQLMLLQKTLLHIEGLGRRLYPDLDLWSSAKPLLEEWLRKRMGPKALINNVKQRIPSWNEKFPEIPELIHDTLLNMKKQSQKDLTVKIPKSRAGLALGLGLGFLLAAILNSIFLYEDIYTQVFAFMLTMGLGGIGLLSILVSSFLKDKSEN